MSICWNSAKISISHNFVFLLENLFLSKQATKIENFIHILVLCCTIFASFFVATHLGKHWHNRLWAFFPRSRPRNIVIFIAWVFFVLQVVSVMLSYSLCFAIHRPLVTSATIGQPPNLTAPYSEYVWLHSWYHIQNTFMCVSLLIIWGKILQTVKSTCNRP